MIAWCALVATISHADTLNDETASGAERPTYRIINLSSRDGPSNSANSINNQALVAGRTAPPDGASRRAALWFFGFRFDLDTLGGPNSNVAWPVKNRIGLIAGIAQTDIVEPLDQTWSCRSFFAFPTRSGFICSAVAWENGEIRALPTLGGYNGFATGANNHRQIVGWAQNTTLDPSCNPLHVKQQFRAVLWGPGANQIRELPPLAGDTTSAATAINDKGQVVGISGDCGTAVGATSAREAVMWVNGRPRVLGNLGGVAWNTPMALNERGDVVGFSNVSKESGATPNWRAFMWTKERGIQDLGALDGFPLSQALGINEKRQVVGTSCTADFERLSGRDLAPGKLVHRSERSCSRTTRRALCGERHQRRRRDRGTGVHARDGAALCDLGSSETSKSPRRRRDPVRRRRAFTRHPFAGDRERRHPAAIRPARSAVPTTVLKLRYTERARLLSARGRRVGSIGSNELCVCLTCSHRATCRTHHRRDRMPDPRDPLNNPGTPAPARKRARARIRHRGEQSRFAHERLRLEAGPPKTFRCSPPLRSLAARDAGLVCSSRN